MYIIPELRAAELLAYIPKLKNLWLKNLTNWLYESQQLDDMTIADRIKHRSQENFASNML